MSASLESLLAEGIITDIVARLKSGKEADVFVVRYGGSEVAAKVYKDHAHRSFKNNAGYREGRTVRSSRSQRAIERGSRFGRAVAEDAWKSAEVDALFKLHAGGVRVPTPVLYVEGVLLMELVRDADGNAARRLVDTALTPAEAKAAYHDMLGQLVRILCCDLVHGDLSPYNVLWGAAGATIIDFPQTVSASGNNQAAAYFMRDAESILGYFVATEPALAARSGDAADIWRAYVRRELTPDFMPEGRPARPAPRPPDRGARSGPAPQPFDRGARPGAQQPFDRGARPGAQQPFDRGARPGSTKPFDRASRPGAQQPFDRAPRSGPQPPFDRAPRSGPRQPFDQASRSGAPQPFDRASRSAPAYRPPPPGVDGEPPRNARPTDPRSARSLPSRGDRTPSPTRQDGAPPRPAPAARRPLPEVVVLRRPQEPTPRPTEPAPPRSDGPPGAPRRRRRRR